MLDPADLPKRFVGESLSRKAAAGIKVMAKANEELAAQRRCDTLPLPQLACVCRDLLLTRAQLCFIRLNGLLRWAHCHLMCL